MLVAPAHPALGGDEEDGGEEVSRAQPYQLHRDTQAVPRSGMYLTSYNSSAKVNIKNFLINQVILANRD